MGSTRHKDFSTQPIPKSWQDAATEAPSANGTFLPRSTNARIPVLPLRSVDMATAGFATAAMSMISGYAWYLINGNGITSPWLAVAVGVLIAMTLRLSSGEGERMTRVMMALVFYLITVSVVMVIIAARDYETLYGLRPSFAQLEQELIHGVLAGPATWAALATGAASSVVTSRLL